MPTAAIVLAAGASTRLEEPKQLVRLGGETLLARTVRMAIEAGCSPCVVVLGANADLIREQANLEETQDIAVVLNYEWQQGMASSIRAGLAEVPEDHSVIVLTCDMPAVTASHLRALVAAGQNGIPVASSYAGRHGVPAFSASSLPILAKLTGEGGARNLLADAEAIALQGGEVDIDTPEDLTKLWARNG